MEIFKLVGSIFVDNTKANESISKTSKEAEGLGGKLKNGLTTAAKWGAGIATAATAVGAAMIKTAQKTSENLDVIDKASQRMKIGAEDYQELAHAAELCGVEMSTMERAAKSLEGTDLSLDDALDQIYSLGTEAERSAKASELFGEKVAYELTPMLNASGEEMANMRQEAHDLGIVMSEDTVKAGAEMNDTFTKVQESFGAVITQVGASLMPLISELLNWILQHMPQIKEVISGVVNTISTLIQKLIPIIQAIAPVVEKLWTNFVQPVLFGVIDFISNVFSGNIEGAFKSLLNIIKTIWDGLKTTMKAPLDWVLNLLGNWWQSATQPFRNLANAIGDIWQSIRSKFKLPHFTLSGSLNPLNWISQGMPKIGVEWYAKGGIMNDPTLFGFNPISGNAMIGGEAGAEAIAPISTLEDYFKKWSTNEELNNKVDILIDVVSSYLPSIANKELVLDTGAIVGGMSEPMNKELFKIKNREDRGL